MGEGQRLLRIGELASRGGVRVSALRFYDTIGLLPADCRVGRHRYYHPRALRRLTLIRAAQEAGLSLVEIRVLLDQRRGQSVREQWQALAERRLPQIDQTITRLQHLRQVVADCLACGCMSLTGCVLLAEQHHGAADP
jgi:MerR family transcriptional regulator, redox-sensitive transcriptional activator SoxR